MLGRYHVAAGCNTTFSTSILDVGEAYFSAEQLRDMDGVLEGRASIPPATKSYKEWTAQFNDLEQYHREHGNMNVRRDTQLRVWVWNQRMLKNKGKLPNEREMKLIGI